MGTAGASVSVSSLAPASLSVTTTGARVALLTILAIVVYLVAVTWIGERRLRAAGVDLDDIVRAVNQVGAAPGDLVAILEALKQAGALRAQLIVI